MIQRMIVSRVSNRRALPLRSGQAHGEFRDVFEQGAKLRHPLKPCLLIHGIDHKSSRRALIEAASIGAPDGTAKFVTHPAIKILKWPLALTQLEGASPAAQHRVYSLDDARHLVASRCAQQAQIVDRSPPKKLSV